MSKRDYLLGRFGGALVTACAFFLLIAVAIFLGGLMPWLDPERIGPHRLAPYVTALGILVWPNTLLGAGIFFSVATLTRSMMATYASVVALVFGYFFAGNLLADVENERLAAIVDPFGFGAFSIASRYWTVAERNTNLITLDDPLLINRALWVGVALLLIAFTYWRFSFSRAESRKVGRRRKREREAREHEELRPALAAVSFAPTGTRFGAADRWGQLLHQIRAEVGGVLRSVAFPVILGFGVLNMVGNSTMIDGFFGTPIYPVTNMMIRILQGASLFIFVILTFYAAEIVWRERASRVDEVHDALPVPDWILWSSKLAALATVLISLLVTAIVTGIGIQAWRGYYNFEIGLYLKGFLLVVGIPLLMAAILAVFLQVVTRHKYLGMLLMILYFISIPALGALDFDHNLYRYGSTPNAPYSDMNGFGHFVQPMFWFLLYWSFGAAILTVLIHLFWIRGKETSFRRRLAVARQRFTTPTRLAAALAAIGFVATGAFIFYNTNILNEYVPGDLAEERQALFEKRYKQYEGIAQPRIDAVSTEIDIYPNRRAVDIRGRYALENRSGETIEALHLTLDPQIELRSLALGGVDAGEPELDDDLGYQIYRLPEPMAPGDELEMEFEVGVSFQGFVNNNSNIQVVHNGTFFNNFQFFPHLGYTRNLEIQDPNDRRKHELPPIQRANLLEDESAYGDNALSSESDWVEFEAVISTTADQIALAPGYLQREWTEGDRRYFHYQMDSPILGFFAFLSADWEVARDRWNDVELEVYYHEGHPYNVERMMDGMKRSLDYFTREFGPYQHRQVRILEFPRYATFAQSFPNTIPFSESIGFIAKLDEEEEDAIDYVFYVTAHEVAHQWWGHQVVGANVQGATMLIETMSQYSALMVMEHEYGTDKMRRFLKYELDTYLRSRGGELIEELPLLRVENQPYVHYRKGSVVMYALKDYLGEENLNAAIRDFVDATKFQMPPYTTTLEFLDFLKRAVPPERHALLADMLEDIVLYDARAVEAEWSPLDDGRYEVRLAVEAKKFRADGFGAETEIPTDDWIDIGVFGEKGDDVGDEGKVLALEKRRIGAGEAEIVLVVDEEPRRAGIDPYHKLIDRNPDNNVTRVSAAG